MADSTFADPDVTTFARLDGLGLRVVGQFLEPDRAVWSAGWSAMTPVAGVAVGYTAVGPCPSRGVLVTPISR